MSKPSNCNYAILPQQAPLVARVHLMDVVRKVGRSERLKGKQIKGMLVKDLHKSREKIITSSYSSRQNSEGDLSSYAINNSAHERKIGNMFPSTHAGLFKTQ